MMKHVLHGLFNYLENPLNLPMTINSDQSGLAIPIQFQGSLQRQKMSETLSFRLKKRNDKANDMLIRIGR